MRGMTPIRTMRGVMHHAWVSKHLDHAMVIRGDTPLLVLGAVERVDVETVDVGRPNPHDLEAQEAREGCHLQVSV